MLWEQTDAAAALRTRFGIADATSAVSLMIDALMEHWGLRITTCERLVLSDRNLLAWVRTPTGPLVIKAGGWQPMFDHLGAVAEIVAQLGALGLPVAAPLRTLIGTACALTDGSAALSVVVLPQTTGDHVDARDPVAVDATGKVLAQVHLALVQLPVPPQLDARSSSRHRPEVVPAGRSCSRARAGAPCRGSSRKTSGRPP